jgi:hypothetical protein
LGAIALAALLPQETRHEENESPSKNLGAKVKQRKSKDSGSRRTKKAGKHRSKNSKVERSSEIQKSRKKKRDGERRHKHVATPPPVLLDEGTNGLESASASLESPAELSIPGEHTEVSPGPNYESGEPIADLSTQDTIRLTSNAKSGSPHSSPDKILEDFAADTPPTPIMDYSRKEKSDFDEDHSASFTVSSLGSSGSLSLDRSLDRSSERSPSNWTALAHLESSWNQSDGPPQLVVRALADYVAEHPTELSLREGQLVNVISQHQSGWWEGEVAGHIGWFPSNYVHIQRELWTICEGDTPRSETSSLPGSITSASILLNYSLDSTKHSFSSSNTIESPRGDLGNASICAQSLMDTSSSNTIPSRLVPTVKHPTQFGSPSSELHSRKQSSTSLTRSLGMELRASLSPVVNRNVLDDATRSGSSHSMAQSMPGQEGIALHSRPFTSGETNSRRRSKLAISSSHK